MALSLGILLLALAWAAITGSFSLPNLLFGLLLGGISLYLVRDQVGSFRSAARIGRVFSLAVLFVKELILSAWRVAKLVLSSKMDLKPGIFAYPLKVDRDFEITLLANLITLTPGTLSVDVSDDRRVLYVHAIDCSDPDAARRDIADGFERKIMEAFR
ncbi:multicomponent Na+:H+ antiporter subunit E [Mesorhizobium soli]|uniref:Na+/H+ antiporter subunit E n=1 Tax=Pseudaminobacter soli (ex Li et al. 2025) TaxID=1295366 RepID=UPI0024763186|nr:Na+/H+ antiporter subunit E [Mesorhizobium soli]MDH6230089.1 multicomponent Na+:H+ antiporter subunit E [Mesorhizobium soli]